MTTIDRDFRLTYSTHRACARCLIAAQRAASMARVTGAREAADWIPSRAPGGLLIEHHASVSRRRPSAADHDPIVEAHPGTHLQPAEVTVTCAAAGCDWTFESQESIGGPVEDWSPAWAEHEAEVG